MRSQIDQLAEKIWRVDPEAPLTASRPNPSHWDRLDDWTRHRYRQMARAAIEGLDLRCERRVITPQGTTRACTHNDELSGRLQDLGWKMQTRRFTDWMDE